MKFLRTFSCFFVILFFHVNTIIAQQSTKRQSLHHVDVLLFGASYNYEHAFGSNFTLSGGLSLITGAYTFYISGSQNNGTLAGLDPSFSLDPRWYTNVNRRVRKGKSVENNSINFVSFLIEYIPEFLITEPNLRNETFAITPRWGFRRSFNQQFFMEFAIGLPYIMDDWRVDEKWRSEIGLHLGIKAGFGFWKK